MPLQIILTQNEDGTWDASSPDVPALNDPLVIYPHLADEVVKAEEELAELTDPRHPWRPTKEQYDAATEKVVIAAREIDRRRLLKQPMPQLATAIIELLPLHLDKLKK